MPALNATPALPEMKDADAPDHIRAIYEGIRRLSAVPMAALIYRNLATHPGVLEEIWTAIGPLFRVGRIHGSAHASRQPVKAARTCALAVSAEEIGSRALRRHSLMSCRARNMGMSRHAAPINQAAPQAHSLTKSRSARHSA
jgi:hypothetical protein